MLIISRNKILRQRNLTLTTKAMNSFLVAAALSTCATAVNIAVDGIIVGRFVSPDALSAVNLYSPYAQTLSIGIIYLVSEIVRRGNNTICRLTHIPKHTDDEDVEQLQLSIPTNMDNMYLSLKTIREFIDRQNISGGLGRKLVLCLEEIFLNINDHSELKGNNHCYDVIIRMKQDNILSVVKDDGRPFNPLTVEEEKRGLGLNILLGICKHIDYQYMYGQNLLVLQFPYE